MHWNYRVVHSKITGSGDRVADSFAIHEAFYGSTEDGRPHSVTVNPIAPFGENAQELQKDLERMQKAFEKPILEYDDF